MKQILPVQLIAYINTECWTYIRMCIIQTLPNYQKWLFSHMTMFTNCQEKTIYFGDYRYVLSTDYYKDILNITEKNIFAIDDIKAFIIEHINNDDYISVFVRHSNDYDHEIFIYVYDDSTEEFDSVALWDNGKFVSKKIKYKEIVQGFSKLKKALMNNPNPLFQRREYTFLLCTLKPCYEYLSRDYTYEYFSKIYHETYGNTIRLFPIDEYEHEMNPFEYMTGVACLLGARNIIEELIHLDDLTGCNKKIYIIRKELFKLLEHRRIISASMKWYKNLWNITNNEILNIIEAYFDWVIHMEETCNLFLKFEQTHDKNILTKVLNKLSYQYSNDKLLLGQYINSLREYYFNEICLNELI